MPFWRRKRLVRLSVLALIALLFVIRRTRARFETVFLGIALFFFGVSLAADRVSSTVLGDWHYLLEDGAKFLGITGWCLFWTTSLMARIREIQDRAARP